MKRSRFHTFISYSRADVQVAEDLERGLEQCSKPFWRSIAIRVFRDEELGTQPGLKEEIEHALARSRWLMVLLSPSSANSSWVDDECSYWLARHGPRRIQLVLLSGKLEWNAPASCFTNDSVVPPALKNAFVSQPNYRDMRWAGSTDPKPPDAHTIEEPRFERDVVALSAPIRRQPMRVLAWRHRHPYQRLVASALTVAVLSVAAGGSLWAYSHHNTLVDTDCDSGISPNEGLRSVTDGVLYRSLSSATDLGSPPRVGIGVSGGLVDSPESEAQSLGYVTSDERPVANYEELNSVPADDTLLQENGDSSGPGRLFIAEAGAVFQIRDAGALWRDRHLDHNEAVIIPRDSFDFEATKPRPKALLHVHGSEDYWVINHRGLRQPARQRCDGANVIDLPNSPEILKSVEVAARVVDRPTPATHSVPWMNLTPQITMAPCVPSDATIGGFLTNVSSVKARFDVRVRLVNDHGKELGAYHVAMKALRPTQSTGWRRKLRRPIEQGMHCRVWIDPTEVDAHGHDVGIRRPNAFS